MKKGKRSIGIGRVRIGDRLFHKAIEDIIVSDCHEGKIRQVILDFYREDCFYIDDIDDVVAMIAFTGKEVIGISACMINKSIMRANMSLTIIHKGYRKFGLGTKLLSSKIHIVENLFPETSLVTQINKTNKAGCKIARRSGMSHSGMQSTKTHYTFLSRL